MRLTDLLLGRSLANRELRQRKLGALEGVPAMGLDGLASSAYGPEAALTILAPLGVLGTRSIWIMGPVLMLLAILYVSYFQTLRAYPTSGGAYTVAKENLGREASLLAATALMIDYVLNVAVAISAGVGALTSALPSLGSHTLTICLVILGALTLVNLRGTREASRLWAVPTYVFVASFFALIALGIVKSLASGGAPRPVIAPPSLPRATEAVSAWLLLRAFASGCTAMTGIEAVSNSMDAFRDPVVKEGRRTLTAIVLILGILLAGIALLVFTYRIGAVNQAAPGYQSVLSQLASAVAGRGAFYYVAMASLLAVLCLSANTSFTGFPRLCRILAQDGFLPAPFAAVGRRLVYSVGIGYLAVTAGLLLAAFGGITDRLIPLFAIGAFLTFTLSQAGMVGHWLRELGQGARRDRARHRAQLAVNAAGTVATGTALAIIIAAKFLEGAWITLLAIPLVLALLHAIRRYYDELARQLGCLGPLDLRGAEPPIVLVAMESWSQLTERAVSFAVSLSPDVFAVHLTSLRGPDVEERKHDLLASWQRQVERPAKEAGLVPPRLVVLDAPHRKLHVPLLELMGRIEKRHPGRTIAVLVPEIMKQRWWENLLHTHRARRLRSALLHYGGSRTLVVSIPWYLEEPRIEDAVESARPTRRRA